MYIRCCAFSIKPVTNEMLIMTSFYLDSLRSRYIHLCKQHEIQYVLEDTIRMKHFPINEFVVNLKIVSSSCSSSSRSSSSGKTDRGEMGMHSADVSKNTSSDINIGNLIEGNTRVSFIRGVAGMGKSVVAKMIVLGWAKRTIYTNFKVCLFFRCRDLNDYMRKRREDPENVERLPYVKMLDKFVKDKLGDLDAKDRESMLIVIDGVDELFDIKDKNSIIYEFLDTSKSYRKSKLILTGRPHVMNVLYKTTCDFGSFNVVEITGIPDIAEYVKKFVNHFGKGDSIEYREKINQTINASLKNHPILHVPQFLNAVCCVFILNDGRERREISNVAEVYSWVLYLLLKQHVLERYETSGETVFSTVFKECRQSILFLSVISFNLSSKSKSTFVEVDYKQIFDKYTSRASDDQKEFLDGQFAALTTNAGKNLQFKHVTLVEYLSAIHICTLEDPVESIKQLINMESYEILHYACDIFGGSFEDGIIKELYTCVIEEEEVKVKENYESERKHRAITFLNHVCDVLRSSESDEGKELLKSVKDIVKDIQSLG